MEKGNPAKNIAINVLIIFILAFATLGTIVGYISTGKYPKISDILLASPYIVIMELVLLLFFAGRFVYLFFKLTQPPK